MLTPKVVLFSFACLTLGAILAHNDKPALKGRALLFLSTDCPIAQQYVGRIDALQKEFSAKGVEFKAYFPNDLETREGVREYMEERYSFEGVLDVGAVEAKRLGVKAVPSVVVLDASGKVVYTGAIDSNKTASLTKNHYLKDAISALVNGKKVPVAKTEPFGCVLMPGQAAPPVGKVNYAEHIAPIFAKNCVTCHRPGEVAPFSLMDYTSAKKWAPMITQSTSSKRMPPWKAVAGYGEFHSENRLTETEIETLKNWSEAGAPSGDLKKAPKMPEFPVGWQIGEPDLVLTPEKEHTLAGSGDDEYRNFVLDPGNKETLWVRGIDVRPGNRKVVHHVIAYIDTSGKAEKLAANDSTGNNSYVTFGGPGFTPRGSLGGWAPGVSVYETGDEVAFEIPPGAKVVMQVHYHRSGVDEKDKTKLGLYLSKQKPKKRLELAWLANFIFRLQPGNDNQKVTLTYTVPKDSTIYGAMPHMHLLGKSMKAEIQYADGTKEPLVWVKDWDFNWQLQYMLKQPKKLPKGTKIYVEGYYDNSEKNPNNPNSPPKLVTWGEQTTDEMFLLVVPYTVDNEFVE
jgi:mono/diheme cytochrome c family protein